MKKIESLFRDLDFSAKESTVYCMLLQLNMATAAELAKKTSLNRTTTYDILALLMRRGLVSQYKKGSATYFNALDPRQLLSYLDREKEEKMKIIDQQQDRVRTLLPEIISLQQPFSSRPKVQFFEGAKGVREAYEDTLTARGTLYAYTNVETMLQYLPDFFPEYFQRRAKAKIPVKAIFLDNEASRKRMERNREELRETRFFPKLTTIFSPETKMYNNKMLIASWSEMVAVIIESKEVVDSQKAIFETLWKSL